MSDAGPLKRQGVTSWSASCAGAHIELHLDQPELFPVADAATSREDLAPAAVLAAYFDFRRSQLRDATCTDPASEAPRPAARKAEPSTSLDALEAAAHTVLAECATHHEGGHTAEVAHVQLASVEVEGFRCFKERVELPLDAQGVTVLTGRNEADQGAHCLSLLVSALAE